MEITEASTASVCCFCFAEGDDDSVALNYKSFKTGLSWTEVVSQLLQINSTSINDALICDSCAATLRLFHKFRKQARTNYSVLEQLNPKNVLLPPEDSGSSKASSEMPVEEPVISDDCARTDYCVLEQLNPEIDLLPPEDSGSSKAISEMLVEESVILEECDEEKSEIPLDHEKDDHGPDDELLEVEYLEEDSLESDKHIEPEEEQPDDEPKELEDLQKNEKRSKRHICPACGHKVESPSKLKIHIVAKHRNSIFDVWSAQPDPPPKKCERYCTICEKSFTTNYNLTIHMRRHNGVKNFECDVCNMKFVSSCAMRRHKLSHTKEKPLKCRHGCSQAFSNHGSRIRHEQTIHSDERPHVCELCEKSFKRQQNLVHHMLTHSGAKPLTCEICGTGFRLRHHLRVHLRGVHKKE